MENFSSFNIRIIGNESCKEGKGESQFAQPRGVCINPQTKELFVVDCNNHRIQVFHLYSLAFIRQIGKGVPGSAPGALMYPVGVCMDDKNHIFVSDTNNHRVVKFNHLTGSFIQSFGTQGSGPDNFHCPYGLCVSNERRELFVADYENNRVQVVDSETGRFLRIIGRNTGHPLNDLHQPIDICLDTERRLLFVADYTNNRVQLFDEISGDYKATIAHPVQSPNAFNGPRSVCIDRASNLLIVSDRENHRVQLFDRNTFEFLRHVGFGHGTQAGQFNRPMELCVDDDTGSLIVVDGHNHRVQIMELRELQKEKLRLKATQRRDASTLPDIPAVVKPSNLAVSLSSFPMNASVRPLNAEQFVLLFRNAAWSYYICVSHDNLHSILPSLVREHEHSVVSAISGVSTMSKHALKLQGQMFLKMWDALVPLSIAREDLDTVASPLLFALQALVGQGWTPADVTDGGVRLMFRVLVDGRASNRSLSSACLDVLGAAVSCRFELHELLWNLIEEHWCKDVDDAWERREKALGVLAVASHLLCHRGVGSAAAQHRRCEGSALPPTTSNSSSSTSQHVSAQHALFGTDVSNWLSQQQEDNAASTAAINTSLDASCRLLRALWQLEATLHTDSFFSRQSYKSLRLQFLQRSLSHLKTLETNRVLRPNIVEKLTRGGRAIWDASSPLQIGDLVDSMDKERAWFESVIVDVLPDGAVLVHFMGWGAKWDDVVARDELATRIAPLNTKTSNWRADLFEGCLIEIKCNDDLVNQKWMWGRVRTLNLEESWVEVAYSFSNEPTVVKKAWLFGETICPVGMHTKDKSRSAAASVVRPAQNAQQIVIEKHREKLGADEMVFFDFDDDLRESSSSSSPSLGFVSDEFSSAVGVSARLDSVVSQSSQCVARMGVYFVDSLVREVSFAISDAALDDDSEEFDVVRELLRLVFNALPSDAFCERVVKSLYLQASVNARFIATLSRQTSDELSWSEVVETVTQLSAFSSRHCTAAERILAGWVSRHSVRFVQERLHNTICRCAFSPVASQAIASFARSSACLHLALGPLFEPRFSREMVSARQFVRLVVQSAHPRLVDELVALVEQSLIKHAVRSTLDECTALASRRSPRASLDSLVEEFARKFYQLETRFGGDRSFAQPRLMLAVPRVVLQCARELSSSAAKTLARFFADALHTILCKGDGAARSEPTAIGLLEELLRLIEMIESEEMLFFLRELHFLSLSRRLLHDTSPSLSTETRVLRALCLEQRALPLLEDVRRSAALNEAFVDFVLSPENDALRGVDFEAQRVASQGALRVLSLSPGGALWPPLTAHRHAPQALHGLALPPVMRGLQRVYELFLRSRFPRRDSLSWCLGRGAVTLQCRSAAGRAGAAVRVDELQAALLLLLGDAAAVRVKVAQAASALNVSVDVVLAAAKTLCGRDNDVSLLLVENENENDSEREGPQGRLGLASSLSLNTPTLLSAAPRATLIDCTASGPRGDEIHAAQDALGLAAAQWRAQRIDASVVRALKRNHETRCRLDELCALVFSAWTERGGAAEAAPGREEVLSRCEALRAQGVLHSEAPSCFAYFPARESESESESDSAAAMHGEKITQGDTERDTEKTGRESGTYSTGGDSSAESKSGAPDERVSPEQIGAFRRDALRSARVFVLDFVSHDDEPLSLFPSLSGSLSVAARIERVIAIVPQLFCALAVHADRALCAALSVCLSLPLSVSLSFSPQRAARDSLFAQCAAFAWRRNAARQLVLRALFASLPAALRCVVAERFAALLGAQDALRVRLVFSSSFEETERDGERDALWRRTFSISPSLSPSLSSCSLCEFFLHIAEQGAMTLAIERSPFMTTSSEGCAAVELLVDLRRVVRDSLCAALGETHCEDDETRSVSVSLSVQAQDTLEKALHGAVDEFSLSLSRSRSLCPSLSAALWWCCSLRGEISAARIVLAALRALKTLRPTASSPPAETERLRERLNESDAFSLDAVAAAAVVSHTAQCDNSLCARFISVLRGAEQALGAPWHRVVRALAAAQWDLHAAPDSLFLETRRPLVTDDALRDAFVSLSEHDESESESEKDSKRVSRQWMCAQCLSLAPPEDLLYCTHTRRWVCVGCVRERVMLCVRSNVDDNETDVDIALSLCGESVATDFVQMQFRYWLSKFEDSLRDEDDVSSFFPYESLSATQWRCRLCVRETKSNASLLADYCALTHLPRRRETDAAHQAVVLAEQQLLHCVSREELLSLRRRLALWRSAMHCELLLAHCAAALSPCEHAAMQQMRDALAAQCGAPHAAAVSVESVAVMQRLQSALQRRLLEDSPARGESLSDSLWALCERETTIEKDTEKDTKREDGATVARRGAVAHAALRAAWRRVESLLAALADYAESERESLLARLAALRETLQSMRSLCVSLSVSLPLSLSLGAAQWALLVALLGYCSADVEACAALLEATTVYLALRGDCERDRETDTHERERRVLLAALPQWLETTSAALDLYAHGEREMSARCAALVATKTALLRTLRERETRTETESERDTETDMEAQQHAPYYARETLRLLVAERALRGAQDPQFWSATRTLTGFAVEMESVLLGGGELGNAALWRDALLASVDAAQHAPRERAVVMATALCELVDFVRARGCFAVRDCGTDREIAATESEMDSAACAKTVGALCAALQSLLPLSAATEDAARCVMGSLVALCRPIANDWPALLDSAPLDDQRLCESLCALSAAPLSLSPSLSLSLSLSQGRETHALSLRTFSLALHALRAYLLCHHPDTHAVFARSSLLTTLTARGAELDRALRGMRARESGRCGFALLCQHHLTHVLVTLEMEQARALAEQRSPFRGFVQTDSPLDSDVFMPPHSAPRPPSRWSRRGAVDVSPQQQLFTAYSDLHHRLNNRPAPGAAQFMRDTAAHGAEAAVAARRRRRRHPMDMDALMTFMQRLHDAPERENPRRPRADSRNDDNDSTNDDEEDEESNEHHAALQAADFFEEDDDIMHIPLLDGPFVNHDLHDMSDDDDDFFH